METYTPPTVTEIGTLRDLTLSPFGFDWHDCLPGSIGYGY